MSAGERIPSSNRAGATVAVASSEDSEEFDFVIIVLGFDHSGRPFRLLRWLEIFNYGFARAIAGNDLDLLLRVGKPFLANFDEIHSFFIAHNQVFQRQFAGLHLLDKFFEAIHCALKVKLCFALLLFAAHGENKELSTALP